MEILLADVTYNEFLSKMVYESYMKIILIFLVILFFYVTFKNIGAEKKIETFEEADLLPHGDTFQGSIDGSEIYLQAKDTLALNQGALPLAFYDQEPLLVRGGKLCKLTLAAPLPLDMQIVIIAHASRSASTLLTRMLDIRGDAFSVREPSILYQILRSSAGHSEKQKLSFVASILRTFYTFACRRNRRLVIKLPSSLSSSFLLGRLSTAAPYARRVAIVRDITDIVTSHSRYGRHAGAGLDHISSIYLSRLTAATKWAEHQIHYNDVVHSSQAPYKISSVTGLPPPNSKQYVSSLSIRQVDAKKPYNA